VADTGTRPPSWTALQTGDLVFFDATSTDTTGIDHVGMYLGRDSAGHDRFISSRKTANGPTLGDVGGASILDGNGYWATAFRSARRM
jgi:cell wall-associated NlpC family hydrolase